MRTRKNRRDYSASPTLKIKKIIASKLMSDEAMKSKEGDFFSVKQFPKIMKENCDIYYREGKKKYY